MYVYTYVVERHIRSAHERGYAACVCVCVCILSLLRIRSAHERGYAALHESDILQY